MEHNTVFNWNINGGFILRSISNFKKNSSPHNTYRFIKQLVSPNVPDSVFMSYGLDKQLGSLKDKIQDCHERVKELNIKMKKQQNEMSQRKNDECC